MMAGKDNAPTETARHMPVLKSPALHPMPACSTATCCFSIVQLVWLDRLRSPGGMAGSSNSDSGSKARSALAKRSQGDGVLLFLAGEKRPDLGLPFLDDCKLSGKTLHAV